MLTIRVPAPTSNRWSRQLKDVEQRVGSLMDSSKAGLLDQNLRFGVGTIELVGVGFVVLQSSLGDLFGGGDSLMRQGT
jgi:hypothetical protein